MLNYLKPSTYISPLVLMSLQNLVKLVRIFQRSTRKRQLEIRVKTGILDKDDDTKIEKI